MRVSIIFPYATAPSSSGPGRQVLSLKIAGSTPAGVTTKTAHRRWAFSVVIPFRYDTVQVRTSKASSRAAIRELVILQCMRVKITSFSYRDGYPADTSSHGGGFVFDTRLLYNPGLIAELLDYHGKEQPIIDYLDKQPDVQKFAEHVFAIIDLAIKNYQTRGYDYLSVSFGCTGGKHRSVYMAEHLARHVQDEFPGVEVDIIHTKGW